MPEEEYYAHLARVKEAEEEREKENQNKNPDIQIRTKWRIENE